MDKRINHPKPAQDAARKEATKRLQEKVANLRDLESELREAQSEIERLKKERKAAVEHACEYVHGDEHSLPCQLPAELDSARELIEECADFIGDPNVKYSHTGGQELDCKIAAWLEG